MDLAAVMDQVKSRLTSQIADLNCYAYPPGTATPPAAIVSYPDRIAFDQTYMRGMDRIESLPVVLLVGKVSDPDARDAIALYAAGSGARSVKQILESGTSTAFDTLVVTDCEFDVYQLGGTDYLAAIFHLDIAGHGS